MNAKEDPGDGLPLPKDRAKDRSSPGAAQGPKLEETLSFDLDHLLPPAHEIPLAAG
jgi:hypothetical protein